MSGGTKPLYLTEETMKIADSMKNFSQWVQKKLIEHGIKYSSPEKQTHRTKEKLRWEALIEDCLRYIRNTDRIAHEYIIPRQPTHLVAKNWAYGYRHEIEMLDLTQEQFIKKVLAREKDDNRRDNKTA